MVFRRAVGALVLFVGLLGAASWGLASMVSAVKEQASTKDAKSGAAASHRRAPVAAPPKSKKRSAASRTGRKKTTATARATSARTTSGRSAAERSTTGRSTGGATSSSKAYGGRVATVDQITATLASAKVGVENAAALAPFFDQLHALESDPKGHLVRVIQFGDSHTAADIFTGALRTLFQAKFGDGGAGFQYPGYPFAGYRIEGTKRAQSTGWTVVGTHLRDIGDGMVGMGGVSLSTAQEGNWVSVDAAATSLEVQYLVQPGGGKVEIYDGEKLLGAVSTDGAEAAGHYDATVEAGSHHFEVRTVDDAPVRLLSVVTENASGVTYEAAGLNGAEASLFLRWNEALQQTLMEANEPALIVLAYGTNEAGDHDWTEESYAAMFRELIARCRRLAPNAAILVVGPPDRALRAGRRGWTPFVGVDRIVQAQRSVCKELGCAYWDQRSRMGGFGSMRDWVAAGWAQPDHTHFTGEGYDELASALFSDIVQQYNAYQQPPSEPPSAVEGDVK